MPEKSCASRIRPPCARMHLRRTRDYDQIYGLLTCPEIYRSMGDDFLPDPREFQVNEHPLSFYVLASNEQTVIGLFSLFPQNMVCWEVHAAMLPQAKTAEKWASAKQLPAWLAENTRCKRLVASVPDGNKAAMIYATHGIGMRYVGRQPKAFMKDGQLQD